MSEQKAAVDRSETKVRVKISPPDRDSDTVTVACKLPNGLVMRLFSMVPITEPGPTGYKDTQRSVCLDEKVELKGTAIDWLAMKSGNPPEHVMISGYALTPGVSRKFWEEWLRQNKDTDLVLNKQVFAQDGEMNARAQAKEYKDIKSGLEPIDPANPTSKSRELGGKFKIERMNREE